MLRLQGGGRVLGISRVEPRSNGLTVRGVATSGRYAAYGYNGYGAQAPVDLTWRCKADYRGYIADIDINRGAAQLRLRQQLPTPYNQYDIRSTATAATRR